MDELAQSAVHHDNSALGLLVGGARYVLHSHPGRRTAPPISKGQHLIPSFHPTLSTCPPTLCNHPLLQATGSPGQASPCSGWGGSSSG